VTTEYDPKEEGSVPMTAPVEPRQRVLKALLLSLSLFGLVGCDHATKLAAETQLPLAGISLIKGVLELRYAQNPDIAFSVLSRLSLHPSPRLLATLGLFALCVITALYVRNRARMNAWGHLGFVMALGGALGNVGDRFFRGYVVDFIHVSYWPVFNVADILVCAGMGLTLVGAYRALRESRITERSSA
jgi:signal peptidase II